MGEEDIFPGGHAHERDRKWMIGAYPSVQDPLADDAEQFLLQNELPLLVFLAALVGLVILPTHSLLALSAGDIADDMATGCHAALDGLGLGDVHDVIEEVSLAVLATEVLKVRRYSVSKPGVETR
jgi:hypothetical protein